MNTNTRSYLRSLADEFNESTNAVLIKLNRLSGAEILKVHPEGNTVMHQANQHQLLFPEISNIGRKKNF